MSEFTDAVENACKREGLRGSASVAPGFTSICPDCLDQHGFCCEHASQYALDSGDFCEEVSFSWSSCDLCGSHLGGDRYAAHYFVDDDPRKEVIHLEVCVDCFVYLANGDEPEEWSK